MRLAPIKNAANFNQFVVVYFFPYDIARGNLGCHAGRVFGENSFVKPRTAERLGRMGEGGASETIAATWQVILNV